jgi:hypothetical protein
MLHCRAAILPLVVVFGLSACAEKEPVRADMSAPPAAAGPNMAPIAAGTALPAGYKVDTARTIIFGTDEAWTGRLSYTTSTEADEVFDFLHKEMPNFGWAEITAMRSDPSLLTFTSSATGRMATITIARGSGLLSTRVDMVVSPSGAGAAR